jgi:hypothetical protein
MNSHAHFETLNVPRAWVVYLDSFLCLSTYVSPFVSLSLSLSLSLYLSVQQQEFLQKTSTTTPLSNQSHQTQRESHQERHTRSEVDVGATASTSGGTHTVTGRQRRSEVDVGATNSNSRPEKHTRTFLQTPLPLSRYLLAGQRVSGFAVVVVVASVAIVRGGTTTGVVVWAPESRQL